MRIFVIFTFFLFFSGLLFSKSVDQYIYKVTSYQNLKKEIRSNSGAGLLIDSKGNILTNAHVVENSHRVEVIGSDGRGFPGEIVDIASDLDLALVQIKLDQSIVVPEWIFTEPKTSARAKTIGFNDGIRSFKQLRIRGKKKIRYVHSGLDINEAYYVSPSLPEGFSGSPVLGEGMDVYGVLFSSDLNRGYSYFVPSFLIQRFFKDREDGNYDGIPDPGFLFQDTSLPLLDKGLGIEKGKGILILDILPGSTFDGILRRKDVLLTIDSKPFNKNGMLLYGNSENPFPDYLKTKFYGDRISFSAYRQGVNWKGSAILKKSKLYQPFRHSVGKEVACGEFKFRLLDKSIQSMELPLETLYFYNHFLQDRLYHESPVQFILEEYPEKVAKTSSFKNQVLERVGDLVPMSTMHLKKICDSYPENLVFHFKGKALPLIVGNLNEK